MNNKYNILVASSSGPEESVFESQVLDMARAWQAHGAVSLCYRSKLSRQVNIAGVNVVRIEKIAPALGRLPLYLERLANEQWSWKGWYDIVHCRGVVAAWQILKSIGDKQRNRVKVLYDCRGIVVEEVEGMWRGTVNQLLLPIKSSEMRRMERFVVNEVDMLTTVSDALSDYLFMHYGRRPDLIIRPVVNGDKFFFSEEQRNIVRQSIGVDGTDRVFLFVGGGDYWQSLHLLKNWWSAIRRANYILIILTHRPNDYSEWLKEVSGSVGRIFIKSVGHSEVSGFMCAADFGILFRDATIVNNVASPVKLSEYLCAGLQVLTNLPVYKDIQPDDIRIVDLQQLESVDEHPIRDSHQRKIRSVVNMERFSAKTAVDGICDYLFEKHSSESLR